MSLISVSKEGLDKYLMFVNSRNDLPLNATQTFLRKEIIDCPIPTKSEMEYANFLGIEPDDKFYRKLAIHNLENDTMGDLTMNYLFHYKANMLLPNRWYWEPGFYFSFNSISHISNRWPPIKDIIYFPVLFSSIEELQLEGILNKYVLFPVDFCNPILQHCPNNEEGEWIKKAISDYISGELVILVKYDL